MMDGQEATPMDLSLVPLEELIAQIFTRHDHGIVALYKDVDVERSTEVMRFKGHYRMVQGLALGAIALAQEQAAATRRVAES